MMWQSSSSLLVNQSISHYVGVDYATHIVYDVIYCPLIITYVDLGVDNATLALVSTVDMTFSQSIYLYNT